MSKSRLAIIDKDKCKPKKCAKECFRVCPVNQIGKMCIEIEEIAKINEGLCTGCHCCQKACPFNAIKIVNIPIQIINNLVHSYGENLFKLYKLPNPKIGKIIGILGENGVGKTTIMNILSGNIIPNFDKNDDNIKITESEVLKKVRGTELQKYLNLLYEKKLKISIKPQNIMLILDKVKVENQGATVHDIIIKYNEFENYTKIIDVLEINKIMDNKIITLSGGELQKIVCAMTLLKDSDVMIFDEPSNYLDIEYRIKIANLIKDINTHNKYIFVVDHDLSILNFVADYIHVMFGEGGAYGVVSTLYNPSEAINIYFDGYIPADNMRFRKDPFKLNEICDNDPDSKIKNSVGLVNYNNKIIKYDNFQLLINATSIPHDTNMIVILGKNGTGKSTYLNYLTNELGFKISLKSQICTNYSQPKVTVKELLYNQIGSAMTTASFVCDVINVLKINKLYNKKVKKLSGGELQRLSIVLCLGKPADIYLIDEPSSSLDIEQRFNTIKVIKRFLMQNKKIGIIIEHDILLAVSLAKENTSKIIIFEEIKNEDGIRYCETSQLLDFNIGINKFLKIINTTFRTDKNNHRPKINKLGSVMDTEQKLINMYYK